MVEETPGGVSLNYEEIKDKKSFLGKKLFCIIF